MKTPAQGLASPATIVFQSAKLGDLPWILKELEWAEQLLGDGTPVGRIFGVSGGNLAALAFSLALAAQKSPSIWGKAANAPADFMRFLGRARSRDLRKLKLNPTYGFHTLAPLRRWAASRLRAYTGREDWRLSELGVPVYLCTVDHDAIFCMCGPPDDSLQCDYPFIHIPPPQDAPLLDALIAGLSTRLSTDAQMVNGAWRCDCRPSIVDAGAIVADLEAGDPRPILRVRPQAAVRQWPVNWFTSSFIMHSSHERNQPLLAESYLDLLGRQRELKEALAQAPGLTHPALPPLHPVVGHVDLPYIGSTEAATNMRQSVENRAALTARFREILDGQLDAFPFDQPANVIYGAGGFSGILAGMAATRAVDEGFARGGGEVRQIYGVSAGVLNGFFHAVQLAAARHPDIYAPAARRALDDLETFMAHCEAGKIVSVNLNPLKFWTGWANLRPLEGFLLEKLAAYTGSRHPDKITFDDIALPLTVTAARTDGFTEFFGMTKPARGFAWSGRAWEIVPAPVVRALLAGWSMNTYTIPIVMNGQQYMDGGGTFYDPGILVACLDPQLANLLNIHLDEPDGHSYNLPPRMNLVNILFDTHNLTFPEQRRRMRALTNLLYEHFRLRAQAQAAGVALPPDFRTNWTIKHSKSIDL
ncbi:MAG: patatin-like phospholipase family protein [Anaerolineales bacterium]|nr:patatin-like phospholipase family protein [Anaerolineales bacterium]